MTSLMMTSAEAEPRPQNHDKTKVKMKTSRDDVETNERRTNIITMDEPDEFFYFTALQSAVDESRGRLRRNVA